MVAAVSTRLHVDGTRGDGDGLCTELRPDELADAWEAVGHCPRLALSPQSHH